MYILNLKLGNPLFLRPYWDGLSGSNGGQSIIQLPPHIPFGYTDSRGNADLVNEIKSIHSGLKNASVDNRYIVIGNGATQILNAILSHSPFDYVYARPPYFFRFKDMFDKNHLIELSHPYANPGFTELITLPSNPDHVVYRPTDSKFKIYDYCYNWPQYGITFERSDDIMVFSLAKATGHAGSRIGWGIFANKSLADSVAKYVENSTGGVSAESQIRAAAILHSQSELLKQGRFAETIFDYGLMNLNQRWMMIHRLNPRKLKIINKGGMFLWIEIPGSQDAATDLRALAAIEGVDGRLLGSDARFVRLNMGCTDIDFRELLNRLSQI